MAFNFFRKKEQDIPVRDIVWLHHSSKMDGGMKMIRDNTDALIVAWFEQTAREWQPFLNDNGVPTIVHIVAQSRATLFNGKSLIVLEHYPLLSREKEVFGSWEAKDICVLNALDEPLFARFGGENIIAMMEKMGVTGSESFDHSLIARSIKNAQEKLDKKVVSELRAGSQEEWFRLNFLSE